MAGVILSIDGLLGTFRNSLLPHWLTASGALETPPLPDFPSLFPGFLSIYLISPGALKCFSPTRTVLQPKARSARCEARCLLADASLHETSDSLDSLSFDSASFFAISKSRCRGTSSSGSKAWLSADRLRFEFTARESEFAARVGEHRVEEFSRTSEAEEWRYGAGVQTYWGLLCGCV